MSVPPGTLTTQRHRDKGHEMTLKYTPQQVTKAAVWLDEFSDTDSRWYAPYGLSNATAAQLNRLVAAAVKEGWVM